MTLIDTCTTGIATHTNDISVLNTKTNSKFRRNKRHEHGFNNNKHLSNKLSIDNQFLVEIDTTLGNYFTITSADTVFYSQTYVSNNIYTKTEVGGLIAGAGGSGGYTDTQIDNFVCH